MMVLAEKPLALESFIYDEEFHLFSSNSSLKQGDFTHPPNAEILLSTKITQMDDVKIYFYIRSLIANMKKSVKNNNEIV
jgi:hypothetical protein